MNTIERILDLIKKNNITAKKLTEDVNISSSSISDWKSGKANPSYSAVIKIAQYFNVSTDYLLCNTDDPAPPNAVKYHAENINNSSVAQGQSSAVNGQSEFSKEEEDIIKIYRMFDFNKRLSLLNKLAELQAEK